MKAERFIFTNAHKPMTIFGVPPELFVITAACAGITLTALVILDLMALSLLLTSAVFVTMAGYFYRRTRQDHHFAKTLLLPPRFWRGRKVRLLIAGNPPEGGRHVA